MHYPWSHSLVTACLWALMIGAAYALVRLDRRGAWTVALLVVSHWLLDVPMHRTDLLLWPGSTVFVVLGPRFRSPW